MSEKCHAGSSHADVHGMKDFDEGDCKGPAGGRPTPRSWRDPAAHQPPWDSPQLSLRSQHPHFAVSWGWGQTDDSAPGLSTTLLYVARQEEVLKNIRTVLTEGPKHLL